MAEFAKKTGWFLVVNISLLSLWLFGMRLAEPRRYDTEQTVSCLMATPTNETFDLLVLGASRARTLSSGKNHRLVEEILNMKMLNLSKDGGAGPLWADLFYYWFRHQANRTRTVLYIIDAAYLHSASWNEHLCSALMGGEPFRLQFFVRAAVSGVQWRCLLRYVRAYMLGIWTFGECDTSPPDVRGLAAVDPFAAKMRVESLYPDGVDTHYFSKAAVVLESIAAAAAFRNERLVFLLPPTLLKKSPGKQALITLLKRMQSAYGCTWHDLSDTIKEPASFLDHDHLNSIGVEKLARDYLRAVLSPP